MISTQKLNDGIIVLQYFGAEGRRDGVLGRGSEGRGSRNTDTLHLLMLKIKGKGRRAVV